MLSALKSLLDATGEFASVQLAQDQEPLDVLSVETPAVVLFHDKHKYAASVSDLLVTQAVSKQVFCQLIVHADQVDAKEQALVQALIGYTHDDQHEPMEAVESDNHKIQGEYYSRWVVLRTQTYLRQS